MLETNVNSSLEMHQKLRPSFRRSLFVVGLLLRFFDFTDKEVIGDLPVSCSFINNYDFLNFIINKKFCF